MEITVKGHGLEHAKVMFVGDYPTKQELTSGYALTRFCEDFISGIIPKTKFNLRESYRTLYVKNQIQAFGFSKKRDKQILEELAPSISEYQEILRDEIETIRPNVIVPMGELALNGVAGEIRIDKFRGSVLPLGPQLAALLKEKVLYKKIKVIPTWHPREIIPNPERKPIISLDFQKILVYKDIENYNPNKYLTWVCRNINTFNEFLQRNPTPEYGVYDIETHRGFITCIAFCFDGKEACSVPLLDDKVPILERIYLTRRIARLLKDKKIRWCNQNILYDTTVLERYGFYTENIFFDTMLAAHTLYIEMLKGLDFLTSIYTDIPYYKDEGKEFDPKMGHTIDQLYIYNAKDALATWQVCKEQLAEFEEDPVKKAFFFDLNQLDFWKESPCYGYKTEDGRTFRVPQGVMPLFRVYKKFSRRGVCIDDAKRKVLKEKYVKILDDYNSELASTIGHPVNVRSPKQVKELVYGDMQCPEIWATNRENGEKRLDTGREALEEIAFNKLNPNVLADASNISILKKIIYARKVYKIVKYLDLPIHPDGRMRTAYKLAGTKSGRSAASTTIDKLLVVNDEGKVIEIPENKKQGLGTGFQTIPKHGFIDDEASEAFDVVEHGKDIMEIFVPTPGYVFVDGDRSQAEARIVAVLAEDYDILEAFDKPNSYIHRLTASWVYQCSPDEIKKRTNEYEMGKRGRHGTNYDMQPFRFSRMCHISFLEAATILDRIHENSPKIRGIFHSTIRDAVQHKRLLVSPVGRSRTFFGKIDDHAFKDGYSWIPQGVQSDTTKFALLRIDSQARVENLDFHILMEVHDNIVAEVKEEHYKRYAEIYKCQLEKPIDFRHCGTFIRDYQLVIPVELGFSAENLSAMTDLKLS